MCGELVFNTVLSGYQEVVTDPSYAGQVVAFTYPHIGNYGVSPLDDEASRPFCRGVVVRDLTERPSSWRAVGSFEELAFGPRCVRHLGGRHTQAHTPSSLTTVPWGVLLGPRTTPSSSRRHLPNRARPGVTSCRR